MSRLTLAYREYTALPQEVVQRFGGKLTELGANWCQETADDLWEIFACGDLRLCCADLSHNAFAGLQSLAGLHALQTLVLDNNNLGSHVHFPALPQLHTLWVNHNRIENLAVFIQQVREEWMGRGGQG